MNQIRAIQALNKREIENGISPEASWHTDYRDTAFVNFGGLPYDLSEGDIVTIFSQYGEPTFVKLARDKETGKSKGFGWLKYEDQRSCDLAVDNLGGAEIAGRLVRVDHARYRARDDEDPDEFAVGWEDLQRKERAARGEDVDMRDADSGSGSGSEEERSRPAIREERELRKLIEEHDEDDPMKGFLIEEKKKEVERALRKEDRRDKEKRHKHRHHQHRHRHRSHRRSTGGEEEGKSDGERGDDRRKRSARDEPPAARDRERRNRDDSDRDRRRDRERKRDREDRDGRGERRSRHEETAERGSRRNSRSKRRSRSRSPASYRD